MSKFVDGVKAPMGHFKLQVFKGGKLIEEIDEPNLIVQGSTYVHAQLLGGVFANNSVVSFGVGANGTAPAAGNTALTGAYINALAAPSFPASNQVQFTFSLGANEANGLAIMEFGLLTGAGTLYARKVRSAALNKAADITLSGTWTISF